MHSTYLYLFILQYLDRDIRWWYGTGTGIGSSYVVGNRAYRGLYLRHGRNASFSVVLLQTCEYGSRMYFGRYQVSDTCLKKERSYRWTMSYGSTQYEVTERFLSFLGGFRSDLLLLSSWAESSSLHISHHLYGAFLNHTYCTSME